MNDPGTGHLHWPWAIHFNAQPLPELTIHERVKVHKETHVI